MLDYAPSVDDSGSSSDEDLDVDLDFELNTPTTPAMSNNESAASISLRNHQKARLGARGRSRHSSNSSASASNSSLASPSPTTPPVQLGSAFTGGYFGRPQGEGGARRKESLSQVLRSSFKIGKLGGGGGGGSMGLFGGTVNEDEKDRPDPIRRPVSRRGSLLVCIGSLARGWGEVTDEFVRNLAQDKEFPTYQSCTHRRSLAA